ncbi:hypothetical protein AAMO2058_000785300 [Amorphochlora amoebiformis]
MPSNTAATSPQPEVKAKPEKVRASPENNTSRCGKDKDDAVAHPMAFGDRFFENCPVGDSPYSRILFSKYR